MINPTVNGLFTFWMIAETDSLVFAIQEFSFNMSGPYINLQPTFKSEPETTYDVVMFVNDDG